MITPKENNLNIKDKYLNMNSENYKNNPINILFENNLSKDSFSRYWLVDTFCVFQSINNILYLIYVKKNNSIISYNIIYNKIINEIKNAHDEYITNFRYYFDKIDNRDLVISISSEDNNIKLWNVNNWECFLNIKNVNKKGWIYSACFFYYNNNNFIITSNDNNNTDNLELIKIYDFKGNINKLINNSKDKTYFINTYYDQKLSKNFILTGSMGYSKSYDYNENKIYNKYCGNDRRAHFSILIYTNSDNIVQLIESSCNGNIRIWNFHSGNLLNKFKISDDSLREICLWNNEYLFVGSNDLKIYLVKIKDGTIIKKIEGHITYVLSLKKIFHHKFGKCLISQGSENETIKLWRINC